MPRKKRRRSWGSITSVSKDKHILRWVENTPDGRKRRSRTLRCTYKEACFELSRIEVEHSNDHPVPTIGDAYSMWYVPWLNRRVTDGKTKSRTMEIYTRCWNLHIGPRWSNTPIDSVRPQQFQEWLLSLAKNNAKVAIVVLRKLGDFAVQYEIMEANKFRIPYEIPDTVGPTKDKGTYSLDEANELFIALRGTLIEPAYIIACFGSARTGESLGVRAREVSLVESHGIKLAVVPIIRRMDTSGDYPLTDGDLKTPLSERVLVIPEPYGTRLFEIVQERIRDGVEWIADRGDGLPINRSALKYMWEAQAGSDAIPFSNLRTSWRTFAQYDWDIDTDTLEILMGHKIPGVTGEHYLRPKIDNLVNAVAKSIVQSKTI